jgi:acetyl esterase/lipase
MAHSLAQTELSTLSVGEEDRMSHYAVIREAGPGWVDGNATMEQPGIQDHADFMKGLAEHGSLLLAGPLAGTEHGRIRADPAVSPIFADLTGLPPLLIQAGSHETLLDDATRLASRAAAYDVDVTLDITPEVAHVFKAFAAILDEAIKPSPAPAPSSAPTPPPHRHNHPAPTHRRSLPQSQPLISGPSSEVSLLDCRRLGSLARSAAIGRGRAEGELQPPAADVEQRAGGA